MFQRSLIGLMMVLAAGIWSASVPAAVVFSDDFEGVAAGGAPDTAKWWVNNIAGTSITVANDVPAIQGTNSLKFAGNLNVTNAQARTRMGGDNYTTFFISVWVRIDNDASSANGGCLDFITNDGAIASSLRFLPKGAGTGAYDVVVLWKTTGGSNQWDHVAYNQPVGVWNQWVFGVQITDAATGAGTYTVYENGHRLANAVSYTPFSANTAYVNQLQLFGDVNSFHLDNVQISNNAIAGTGPLFMDDFEAQAPGNAPNAGQWHVYSAAGSATVANDVTAAQGTNSLKIAGTTSANAQVRTTIAGDNYTTFFVSAWVRIDADTSATNGADLDLVTPGGSIAVGLRFLPKGAGTGKYDVKILDGPSIHWDLVAAGQPIGVWNQWLFGIQITNPTTGAGVFTVYQNGILVANAVSYTPFSANTTYVTQLQASGDISYHLDSVQIYNTVTGPVLPGVLTGRVTMENYTGSEVLTPVTIQVRQGGSLVTTLTVPLDAAGNYSLASGLAAGVYDLTFKSCCWLSQTVTGVVISTTAVTPAVNVTLPAGDVSGGNAVTNADLSAVLANMDAAGDQ